MPVTLDCNVQESELKSAQQAAELAAAKQESARRLAAHQDFKRVRPATYVHKLACKTLRLFQQVMMPTFIKIVLYTLFKLYATPTRSSHRPIPPCLP